jgi:phytoene dehydrogenase-like protein
MSSIDAVVVGSGPNGLAAAVTLARAGLSVTVLEANSTIGGGARTAELTLPGFRHDVGSAIHPMALASPFFREFGLDRRITLTVPELSYAQPLDGRDAAVAWRDLDRTADELGADGAAWRRLFAPLVDNIHAMTEFASSPLLRVPRHPLVLAAFGLRMLEQGSPAWNARFREAAAPALLTGVIAHSIQPLPSLSAAAAGLVLAAHAHAAGWPVPTGGSQSIIDAMADDLRAHGGIIETDSPVTSLDDLRDARVVIFDTTPRALLEIGGDRVPAGYAKTLRRFRYGNAIAKVDYALSAPVPWRDARLAQAPTLHLGGFRAEVAGGEKAVSRGRLPRSPYVLVAQPSSVDPTRAPEGRHVLWAYTHVPHGSTADRSEAIAAQIERFAPGFRDTILADTSRSATQVESTNRNYIGGDISAGDVDLRQLIARPTLVEPWRTPVAGVYLCSSATSPGPGVHGLAGWHAARSALKHEFGITAAPDLSPERA